MRVSIDDGKAVLSGERKKSKPFLMGSGLLSI
jgi:hypothetical protein